jgi:hypothetical protein
MKFKTIALGTLLSVTAGSAFASTADFRIIGTFVPGSCLPTFASAGVVDYGNIASGTRSIAYTISCDAPIEIATTLTDNRTGSASTVATTHYGLGSKGTVNTGFYTVAQLPGSASAGDASGIAAVDLIERDGTTGAWSAVTSGVQAGDGGRQQAYAPTGTLIPGAFQEYAGTLQISASIAQADSLDLASEIVLDGLATFEVRYL